MKYHWIDKSKVFKMDIICHHECHIVITEDAEIYPYCINFVNLKSSLYEAEKGAVNNNVSD